MKKFVRKALLSTMLACGVFMGTGYMMPNSTMVVQAASNSTYSTAKTFTLGKTTSGTLSSTCQSQYFKFTMDKSGVVNFIMNSDQIDKVNFSIYDMSQQSIRSTYYGSTQLTASLAAGTYYLVIKPNYNDYGSFTIKSSVSYANDTVNNDRFSRAKSFTIGTDLNNNIAYNQEISYYKFTMDKSGVVSFIMNSDQIDQVNFEIYDMSQKSIDSTHYGSTQLSTYLAAGSYYLLVKKNNDSYGNYILKSRVSYANDSVGNNCFSKAKSFTLGNSLSGNMAYNQEVNYYKFTMANAGTVKFQMASDDVKEMNIIVYDKNQREITRAYHDTTLSTSLSAGTYYLCLKEVYTYGNFTMKTSVAYKGKKTTTGTVKPIFKSAKLWTENKTITFKKSKKASVKRYKIIVKSNKTVSFKANNKIQYKIYGNNGYKLLKTMKGKNCKYSLKKGTYFLEVKVPKSKKAVKVKMK